MVIRRIIQILPKEFYRTGGWIVATVPVRALLNLVGVAALLPVLQVVLDENTTGLSPVLICLGVLGVIFLKNLLNILLGAYQNRYLLKIYRYFSTALFSNLYRKGLLYVKGRNSAEISHEINGVCYSFSLGVLSPLLNMAGELLLLLLIYIGLIFYSPIASVLVPVCFIPVILLYVHMVKNRVQMYGKRENEARRKMWKTVVETFRGYAEVEVNGAFPSIARQFDDNLLEISQQREKMTVVQQLPSALIEFAVVGCMVLLVALSGAFEEGSLSVMVGVFAIAAMRMLPAVRTLANGWTSVKNGMYSLDIIEQGLSEEGVCNSVKEQFTFEDALQMRGVSFTFPEGGHKVFDRFSMEIRKGEKVGIKGASGAGKTTLFNLLLGFYRPDEGGVYIDGKELTVENRAGWLKYAGYVQQDVFILDASLAQNIALGVRPEDIDREKVERIIQEVSLSSYLKQLPEGIDSRIGEMGAKLSGGQKQRVGIARALYKGADILFLDEATSSLDSATEVEINESILHLSRYRSDLTIVAIAHRESSLAFCDRIVEIF
ncbi:MAG: ABC transporter ATP-binding protein [Bacteroidales bacterium]|nr:ABC transporter ATP-binding protein [Bacteroidales bacterium]